MVIGRTSGAAKVAAISVRSAAEQIRPQQPPSPGRQEAHIGALQEEHPMQAFIVEGANRPGELGRVADTIATREINVEAFCLSYGNTGATAFLANDETGIRSALEAGGFTYREVPLLTIWLEDKPGQVAWAAKRLGEAGVNIELFAPVEYGTDHKATIAIGVDKVDDARRVLSDHLTDWKIPEKALAGSMSR
jgi:hypothetical protein